MIRIALLALFIFASLPAQAELTGLFSGVGYAKDGDGWSSQCPFAYLALNEGTRRFTVREGHFNCDGKFHNWSGSSFNLRNDVLTVQGTKVGERIENGFKLYFKSYDDWVEVEFKMIDGKLHYFQRTTDPNGKVTFEIVAELHLLN